MSHKEALYLGVLVAVIVFCCSFVYPSFSSTPTIWYYPLEHRWAFELKPNGLAMDWYGRNVIAGALSGVAFAGVYWVARKRKQVSPALLRAVAVWAMSAVLVVAAFYIFQLASRHPVPMELPSWYVPK